MWRVWQAYLDGLRGVSFPKLVEEAFLLFHALFRDKLLQVIPLFILTWEPLTFSRFSRITHIRPA